MQEKELDNLFQAFDEACTEDAEVTRACLEESGIDPDALVREGSALVKKQTDKRKEAAPMPQFEVAEAVVV